MATGLEKVNPHSSSQEGWYQRMRSPSVTLISHASKVMLKIWHARLQHYMNQELPDVQAAFRKERGTRDQTANIFWITEKAREFQKTSTSVPSTTLKPLTLWIMTNCGKLLERWEYQTILPVS